MEAARRAGSSAANEAMVNRTTIEVIELVGSDGVIPKRRRYLIEGKFRKKTVGPEINVSKANQVTTWLVSRLW